MISTDEQTPQVFPDLPTAIASLTSACILVSSPQTLTASLTIPASIQLRFVGNGKIIVPAGSVLTINGAIEAGLTQIFSGTVKLAQGSCPVAWVEWWGAKADAFGPAGSGTDNAPAINAAILAVPSNDTGGTIPVQFAGHNYRVASSINVINNAANGNRRSMVIQGIGGVRRGDDVSTGTSLMWDGNATDPLFKLHTYASRIEGFTIRTTNTATLSTAIDIDRPPSENNTQIISQNHIKNIQFAGQNGTILYGIQFGESGISNDEHHRIESCFFNHLSIGIWVNNGTGQSKFLQIIDCSFDSCSIQGFAAGIASASFEHCNFTNMAQAVYFGGSYDPISFRSCDSEGITQFLLLQGGAPLTVEGCRFATNAIPTLPAQWGEYVAKFNAGTFIGCNFDVPNANFLIRPADGGVMTAINTNFAATNFLPTDGKTSWSASFIGCGANHAPINDGLRNYRYSPHSTEINGTLRLSPNSGKTLNTTGGAELAYDPTSNRLRVRENNGPANPAALVWPWGDRYGVLATFTAGSGAVPPSGSTGWNYKMTFTTAAGESLPVTVAQQVSNSAAGSWALTNLPLGPAGTIARTLYRIDNSSRVGGSVIALNDNTTTSCVDSTATTGTPPPTVDASGIQQSAVIGTFSPTPLATSTTVGAAGAAAALPTTPTGYVLLALGGQIVKVPYFNS